jgi:hypothetical protein
MVASDPGQGGATWAVLQYLLGLRQLGHEVYFVEPIAEGKLQPKSTAFEQSVNARYFHEVTRAFGFSNHAALLLQGTKETIGLPYSELRQIAKNADLLINVSGMLSDEALLAPVPQRIYLDLDPAFIQLWQAVSHIDMRFDAHTAWVTVGQAIGDPTCPVPTCDREWIKTLPPVVLAEWPVASTIRHNALTTVANWRGYGSIKYDGAFYGQKAHSLRQFFSLPKQTTEKFQLALSIHPGETNDIAALEENNWDLLDAAELTGTPASYRQFVQDSKAEFGIAKSGYVVSRCGWFSDRSACYLASGRPVLAQETGFSKFIPTGEGLFSFETESEVLTAIDRINSDYPKHARAARQLAEEYFNSDKVLPRLLETIGVSS